MKHSHSEGTDIKNFYWSESEGTDIKNNTDHKICKSKGIKLSILLILLSCVQVSVANDLHLFTEQNSVLALTSLDNESTLGTFRGVISNNVFEAIQYNGLLDTDSNSDGTGNSTESNSDGTGGHVESNSDGTGGATESNSDGTGGPTESNSDGTGGPTESNSDGTGKTSILTVLIECSADQGMIGTLETENTTTVIEFDNTYIDGEKINCQQFSR